MTRTSSPTATEGTRQDGRFQEKLARLQSMQRDARQMRITAAQMLTHLGAQWKWLAQYLGAPRLLSLPFFDPSFVVGSDRRTALTAAVDAALALGGADMGNVQLWDRRRGVLRIEAQRGFSRPFLDFFAGVHEGQAACGLALRRAARVIVEDVAESPVFRDTPGMDVMLDAGAYAVQSMPLIDSSGRLLGVLSTHWHRRRRPGDKELRLLALLERRTTGVLQWHAARAEG
jgi:hypothetical protein